MSLYEYALLLHREGPDEPLPGQGESYPDQVSHRLHPAPGTGGARAAAAVLGDYFARPDPHPRELHDAFDGLDLPYADPDDHFDAAVSRADPGRVRAAGRWLVRHGTDRCPVTAGMWLLASAATTGDIPLIRTVGLLSERFAPVAARALRRLPDGGEALLWLAQRVDQWGRVHVINEICEMGVGRDWLLRNACDGDFLNGYFAGRVAVTANLHDAIRVADPDDRLVDHTTTLLGIMSQMRMSMALDSYPDAVAVLTAHAGHIGRLAPDPHRFRGIAALAGRLARERPEHHGCTAAQRDHLVGLYRSVLDRPEWCAAARVDEEWYDWMAEEVNPGLGLRAFGGDRQDGAQA